jgi:hypothetical protein
MDYVQLKALFEVRKLQTGSGCYIRATMPNGSTEQVYGFETPAKASEWIVKRSEAWLSRLGKGKRSK